MVTEGTTTRDAWRLKWLKRQSLLSKIKAAKDAYKAWLRGQGTHTMHQEELKAFEAEVTRLEHGMDECASLGEQGDFAVDLEPGANQSESST